MHCCQVTDATPASRLPSCSVARLRLFLQLNFAFGHCDLGARLPTRRWDRAQKVQFGASVLVTVAKGVRTASGRTKHNIQHARPAQQRKPIRLSCGLLLGLQPPKEDQGAVMSAVARGTLYSATICAKEWWMHVKQIPDRLGIGFSPPARSECQWQLHKPQ